MSENASNCDKQNEDSSTWWASVWYRTDRTKEYVPVTSVFLDVECKTPFRPKSFNDHIYGKLYVVSTAFLSKSGRSKLYYAQIGRVAATKEDLKLSSGRTKWAPFPHGGVSEPPSTSDEMEVSEKSRLSNEKTANAAKKATKKAVKKNSFKTFMENHENLLFSVDSTEVSRSSVPSSSSQSNIGMQRDSTFGGLDQNNSVEMESLRKRIQELEQEKQALVEKNSNIINYLDEKLDALEARIQFKVSETMISKFTELEKSIIQKVGDTVSSSRSSETTSGVSCGVEENEKVHIGLGFYCQKQCYDNLTTTLKDHSDWGRTLLQGVFGEKAPFMRVKVMKTSQEKTEKFPLNFLTAAKALLRQMLEKQTVTKGGVAEPEYSKEAIEAAVTSLPKFLSSKSINLNGARGLVGKIQQARKDGQDVAQVVAEWKSSRPRPSQAQPASQAKKRVQREDALKAFGRSEPSAAPAAAAAAACRVPQPIQELSPVVSNQSRLTLSPIPGPSDWDDIENRWRSMGPQSPRAIPVSRYTNL